MPIIERSIVCSTVWMPLALCHEYLLYYCINLSTYLSLQNYTTSTNPSTRKFLENDYISI